VFGHPAAKPRYFRGIPETWWYDRDKAAKLEQKG
jgi:microcin C transport system substrate-binding protein